MNAFLAAVAADLLKAGLREAERRVVAWRKRQHQKRGRATWERLQRENEAWRRWQEDEEHRKRFGGVP